MIGPKYYSCPVKRGDLDPSFYEVFLVSVGGISFLSFYFDE